MPLPLIALVFLLVPLLEVFLLLKIGGIIGAWATIGLIVLTAIIGAVMLKQQGLATLQRLQRSVDQGQLPGLALLEAMFLLVGGVLLLTPGFFTDAVGFACLIPPVRQAMAGWLLSRSSVVVHSMRSHGHPRRPPAGGRIIEGDYTAKDDEEPPRR